MVSSPGRGDRAIEQSLLGERRRYTWEDLASLAQVPMVRARRLWRALGFVDVGEQDVAFTDADVDALQRIAGLIQSGAMNEGLALSMTRALGRNMSRLVDWLGEGFAEQLITSRKLLPDEAARTTLVQVVELLPELDALVVYVWRRQLAETANRVLGTSAEDLVSRRLAVGFADLVGYTRLAERLEDRELGRIVEKFEGQASDIVVAEGGRVVKMVGDEILFVVDDAHAGAEIALRLAEAMAADKVIPDVRVGVAFGTVLSRMGDVFGTTVNLASRLAGLVPPGGILIDRELANALQGYPEYDLEPYWRRRLRALGTVEPSLLTRTQPDTPG